MEPSSRTCRRGTPPAPRRRRRSTAEGMRPPAELREQVQRPEARLAQVADGQQPEAAVEELRRAAQLLEVVGRHPVGQGVGRGQGALHAAQHERRGEDGVADPVEVGGRDAPLGPQDLRLGLAGGLREGAGLADGSPAARCRRCAWRRSRSARRSRGSAPAAGRPTSAAAEPGPPTLMRGSTRLHGARRGLVEQVVLGLGAVPEDLQVGLVPDLELPGGHLVRAVALTQVHASPRGTARPSAPSCGAPRRCPCTRRSCSRGRAPTPRA